MKAEQAFLKRGEDLARTLEKMARFVRETLAEDLSATERTGEILSECSTRIDAHLIRVLIKRAILADKEREQTIAQTAPDPFAFQVGDSVRINEAPLIVNGACATVWGRVLVDSTGNCPSGRVYLLHGVACHVAERFLELAAPHEV